MPPAPSLPDFGRMTVSPLFGWGTILAGVVLVLVVATVAFLLLASGKGQSGRAEFEAWLDARSPGFGAPDPDDAGTAAARDRAAASAGGDLDRLGRR
jgi:hypothetical protein